MVHRMVAVLLLAVFAAQSWWCATAQSPTFDEVQHVPAGHAMWTTGRFDLGIEQAPLARLWMALPLLELPLTRPAADPFIPGSETRPSRWMIGNAFDYGHRFLYDANPLRADGIILRARLAVIALGVALGWLVYLGARTLGGPPGGLLALFLYALSPGFVAHSALATTDVAASLLIVGTLLAAERFRVTASRGWAAATGAALGAALATKHTAVLLPFALLFAWLWCRVTGEAASRRGWPILLAAAWVALCAAYGFREPLTRHAVDGAELAALVPGRILDAPTAWLYAHAPLPDFYLRSLLFNLRHVGAGGPVYAAGLHASRAPWWYTPLVLGVKLPVLTLAMLLATAGSLFPWPALEVRRPAPSEKLLVVGGGLLLAAAVASGLALGLRVLLPALAIGLILTGRLGPSVAAWLEKHPRRGWALAAVMAAHAVSVGSVLPHSLAYANEPAGGPARLERWLADSNLDWGRGLPQLKTYLDGAKPDRVFLTYNGSASPGFYGLRYEDVLSTEFAGIAFPAQPPRAARPGERTLWAISLTALHAPNARFQPLFAPLLERRPIARVGHAFAVYDLTDDPDLLRFAESLARVASPATARAASPATARR